MLTLKNVPRILRFVTDVASLKQSEHTDLPSVVRTRAGADHVVHREI